MKFVACSIGIVLMGCLVSCGTHSDSSLSDTTRVTIVLQPFEGTGQTKVDCVYKALCKIYPSVHLNSPIPLPASAYYKERNRYKADSLISYLRKHTGRDTVTIGLTEKDISTRKGKIADYGIMGLGYQPGRACVVSTFRLSKQDLLQQYVKVSVHELGHTQGLPHCAVLSCFMRDAEGKNHLSEETAFCSGCSSHLVKRGWTLTSR